MEEVNDLLNRVGTRVGSLTHIYLFSRSLSLFFVSYIVNTYWVPPKQKALYLEIYSESLTPPSPSSFPAGDFVFYSTKKIETLRRELPQLSQPHLIILLNQPLILDDWLASFDSVDYSSLKLLWDSRKSLWASCSYISDCNIIFFPSHLTCL